MILFSQYNTKKRVIGMILYYCSMIITLVLGFLVLTQFVPSYYIFHVTLNGYCASLFNSVTVSDMLICAVTSFSKHEIDTNAPHNLYSKIDNNIKLSTAIIYMCKRAHNGMLYLLQTKDVNNSNNNDNDVEKQSSTDNPMRKN
jgi:hypothetical protein